MNDKLVKQVAVFLCELWDDDWQEGERFHTSNAKQLINLIGVVLLERVVEQIELENQDGPSPLSSYSDGLLMARSLAKKIEEELK